MNRIATLSTMIAAGSLTLSHAALAQNIFTGQEIGVHAGYLWGDTAMGDTAGPLPELSNGPVYGLHWGMNVAGLHGWELRYTYADTDLDDTADGSISMPLHLLDVNYALHFPMRGDDMYRAGRTGAAANAPSWFLTAGAGWAFARLDQTFMQNGQIVDGGDGFTLNAGGGVKWPIMENHAVRWDLRYRYLDQVVDRFDDSLNTWETTVGYAIRF